MRQARVAKSGGNGASYSEKIVIRKMLGDRCAYCGEALNGRGHFDHMTPIAKGGLDAAINMTLACPSCNEEKHSKTVEQYALWRKKCGLLVLFHPSVKSKKEIPQKTVQKFTCDTAEFKPNEALKAKVTVATFAEELGIHKNMLMVQLYKAGIKKESPEETLSARDKGTLLDYLRKMQLPNAKNLSA